MPDWTKSMTQTFEYTVVDPGTWKDVTFIDTVKKCKIDRDSTAETRGSAMLDVTNLYGETYIRVYLVTIQNGIRERHPLGTYLVQTPSSTYNGMTSDMSMDAYTPLLELKEKQPPIGYALMKKDNIMNYANLLVSENARAPVVNTYSTDELPSNFVANIDDTWLSFISDLTKKAKYEIDLDDMGRIVFSPVQDLESLQPIWTYNDDNSSILYPEITVNHDIYGIPNVIEVIYSKDAETLYAKAVNDDPASPVSTVSRGREILYRTTEVNISGTPDQAQIQEYAENLLKTLSSVEYTISYTHGYCGTRVGDCIMLNYKRAGLSNIKAKIISQSISCEPGTPVSETAKFTTKLWR